VPGLTPEPAYAAAAVDRWGIPAAADAFAPTTPVPGVAPVITPPVPLQPSRPGAAAPPGWVPPARTGQLGAWGWGSTGFTVIGAILLGALMQLLMYLLAKNGNVQPEAFIRYAIVATIAFYALVSVIVLQRLHVGSVRLYWTDGKPLHGIATGLAVGLTLGLLALGINSAVNGRLTTDPNITLMTSEGDVAHILAVILIAMIAAPLVEETLFRGLLAESLRSKGKSTAIWVSALAFAAWHLNPAALRYYAMMGALLCLLYWKRGLLCSMAAHAAFNGVLTVAAIVLALAPGAKASANGLTIHAPSGWHQLDRAKLPGGIFDALQGPSGATVLLTGRQRPLLPDKTADQILNDINAGRLDAQFGGYGFNHSAATKSRIPAGEIVRIHLSVDGHQAEVVYLPIGHEVFIIVLESNGSVKARVDFNRMLHDTRFGSDLPSPAGIAGSIQDPPP
jgi:membrane protease YdiL (CAAX protease family)